MNEDQPIVPESHALLRQGLVITDAVIDAMHMAILNFEDINVERIAKAHGSHVAERVQVSLGQEVTR